MKADNAGRETSSAGFRPSGAAIQLQNQAPVDEGEAHASLAQDCAGVPGVDRVPARGEKRSSRQRARKGRDPAVPTVALEPVTGPAASPALLPRRACRVSRLTDPFARKAAPPRAIAFESPAPAWTDNFFGDVWIAQDRRRRTSAPPRLQSRAHRRARRRSIGEAATMSKATSLSTAVAPGQKQSRACC